MADRLQPQMDVGAMPRLLLVEDNPLHVRLVRSMLDEVWPGYENLAHVTRLDKAIDFLGRLSPDCILLDLVLPDADGLEAVHGLLAVAPEIPIVVLSSHADEAAATEAVRQGAQDYLVKGMVGAEALAKAVRFAIERHRTAEDQVSDREHVPRPTPATDVGTAILDNTGAFRFADAVMADILGRDLSEFVGVRSDDVIHGADLAAWRDALAAAGENAGTVTSTTTRVQHGSGSALTIDVELAPLYAADGSAGAFIARCRARLPEGTLSSGGSYVVMSGWVER